MKHKKYLLSFILVLAFLKVVSKDSTANLNVRIIDGINKNTIEKVSVTLFNLLDSTIVDFKFTNKNGVASISNIPLNIPLRILYTHVSYASFKYDIIFEDTLTKYDSIELFTQSNELRVAQITWERAPIVMRGDTMEFDAEAFLNKPGTMVEELIQRIPGISFSDQGIQFNGKNVSKITLDGKQFFGDDPSLLLKNIPSLTIDKVQITEEKNAFGKLNKKGNVTINLKLKKEAKKGNFGKVFAGYGTDKRYESGLLWNLFRDTFQISIIAHSNNLSQAAFSYTDLFNIGGFNRSKSNRYSMNSDGSFFMNGISMGGGNGITTSTGSGFNINHNPTSRKELSISYFYNKLSRELVQLTNTNFNFNDSSILTTSNNTSNSITHNHTASMLYTWRKDSVGTFRISTNYSNSNLSQDGFRLVSNIFNKEIFNNNLENSLLEKENNHNFSNSIFGNYYLKPNLYVSSSNSVNYSNNIKNTVMNQILNSNNQMITDENFIQNLDQVSSYLTISQDLGIYKEWNDMLNSEFNYEYKILSYKTPISVFQKIGGASIEQEIPELSSSYTATNHKQIISKSLYLELENIYMDFSVNYENLRMEGKDQYRNIQRSNKSYNLLGFSYFAHIMDFKKWSGYISIDREFSELNLSETHPFLNNLNPRFRSIGNINLEPEIENHAYLNLSKNIKKVDIVFYGNFTITQNPLLYSLNFDEVGREIQTVANYQNYRTNNSYSSLNISRTFKNKKNWELPISLGLRTNSNSGYTFYSEQENRSVFVSNNITPRVAIKKSQKIDFSVSYTYSFQNSKNTLFETNKNIAHSFFSELWLSVYKNLWFEAKYRNNYQPLITNNISSSFNMLHLSLNQKVFKDKSGTIKLSVFDLLKQNTNISRNVSANRVIESQSNNVTRYYMLSFVYNINSMKLAEKEKYKTGDRIIIF
jgi:hypothetical protein